MGFAVLSELSSPSCCYVRGAGYNGNHMTKAVISIKCMMLLESQGHSRKNVCKNEEKLNGTTLIFIWTKNTFCAVIFLAALRGILICSDSFLPGSP